MRILLGSLLFLCVIKTDAQNFGNGNLVVVRIGTASLLPMTAGAATNQYSSMSIRPAVSSSEALPYRYTTSGSNRRLTLPPASADYSEGFISLSEDGQYLALGGYDAATGYSSCYNHYQLYCEPRGGYCGFYRECEHQYFFQQPVQFRIYPFCGY